MPSRYYCLRSTICLPCTLPIGVARYVPTTAITSSWPQIDLTSHPRLWPPSCFAHSPLPSFGADLFDTAAVQTQLPGLHVLSPLQTQALYSSLNAARGSRSDFLHDAVAVATVRDLAQQARLSSAELPWPQQFFISLAPFTHVSTRYVSARLPTVCREFPVTRRAHTAS